MPKQTEESKSSSDAWRCGACRALIYNRDADGHPAPGAPKPLYLDHRNQNICMTCFQMGLIVRDDPYWKAQQDAYYERLRKAMGGQ
jgi:hypothetical protein